MTATWYPRYYYIVKHRLTDVHYIGQRVKNDVGVKYFGSGVHWLRHRKQYGWLEVDVVECKYFTDKAEAQKWLDDKITEYGDYWKYDHFANLIPETVDDKASQFGFKHSEETKRRMSEVRKGRPQYGGVRQHSDEARHRMSVLRTGRKLSDEDKRKKSEAHKGKPKSEVHKQAMRGVVKKKVNCPICDRLIGSHNLHRHLPSCEKKNGA